VKTVKKEKVIFAAGSKGKKCNWCGSRRSKKLIKAAKNSGVNKFVMLSTMGADNPSVKN
jgi:FlaA1/EpsC-like NDP-sugar epimerase